MLKVSIAELTIRFEHALTFLEMKVYLEEGDISRFSNDMKKSNGILYLKPENESLIVTPHEIAGKLLGV